MQDTVFNWNKSGRQRFTCMSSHEKKRQVILKFQDHKLRYQVIATRKKLMGKKNELKELHFEESLYLSYSMCTENHNLF